MIKYNKAYIVDDEIEIVEIIEPILEEVGFQMIHKICDSKELFKSYDSSVDLLILDLFMPNTDGIEILRYLGELKSEAHIILMSGHSSNVLLSAERVAKAYGLKIIGSIGKPFSINSIIDLITNYNQKYKVKVKNPSVEIKYSKDFFLESIRERYFILFYQPQVDLKNKTVIGFEALVRLNHPKYGLIFPDQFLNLIESFGLIAELTEYIIHESFSFFGKLISLGYNKRVSINISISDLVDTAMPEHLISLANKYKIDPSQVVIELIETGDIGNNPKSLEILTRLSMKGFRLSIDDFGTGYSSLEQLSKAPFNELKIDKSFVFDLLKDSKAKYIIESTVSLAHKLNIEVVAEGIENKEMRDVLLGIDVDIGQGYHFSIPMPENAIIDYLNSFSF
ncbi:EAL domain-containing protein [Leptospira congkakensis]|uniref:EAL domain-containing protein n=1 Tax=Leptospira congkakensis TaxID=2484932 RepID=A0A4Z0ZYV0_9LEPT|nr:EAL domain-containing response regulator [Leptospira congkakensis]TGL86210.1 EAL domain-containing protein [Leptospira congkakensis]TGL94246.1 EAL domain-containing protein [Leptospira congkakensis]TGL94344.1 EAL domain-containing protein [Leptospira congkakensis]